jgi:hypothetical protein
MAKAATGARDASKRDKKMIEIKVRFWTNDLAPEGAVLPKTARSSGVVRIESNAAHGITSGKARPFNSFFTGAYLSIARCP